MKAVIQEIFWSIQGEGLLCGTPQLFVRFHGCNLACDYCDTPASTSSMAPDTFAWQGGLTANPLSLHDLQSIIAGQFSSVHSISITGGEPLCQGEFVALLGRWLCQEQGTRVLLETNGTYPDWLTTHQECYTLVSADLKFPWADRNPDQAQALLHFLQQRFDKGYGDYVKILCNQAFLHSAQQWLGYMVAKSMSFPIILQPLTVEGACHHVEEGMQLVRQFTPRGLDIRIIPQIHHFLGVS